MNSRPPRLRPCLKLAAELAVCALLMATVACDSGRGSGSGGSAQPADDAEPSAPYQAEVEEGLGAAVAILVDTSGSMTEDGPGRLAAQVRSSPERRSRRCWTPRMRSSASRPDFPIKIGCVQLLQRRLEAVALQLYDRGASATALIACRSPGGGTAIGEAMRDARPDLYRAGVFPQIPAGRHRRREHRRPQARRPSPAKSSGRAKVRCRSTSSRSTRAPRSSRS